MIFLFHNRQSLTRIFFSETTQEVVSVPCMLSLASQSLSKGITELLHLPQVFSPGGAEQRPEQAGFGRDRVLFLSEEVPRQILSFDASLAASLSKQELERALAHEASIFSGLDAETAVTQFAPLPEAPAQSGEFAVIQASREFVSEVRAAVRLARFRFAGIAGLSEEAARFDEASLVAEAKRIGAQLPREPLISPELAEGISWKRLIGGMAGVLLFVSLLNLALRSVFLGDLPRLENDWRVRQLELSEIRALRADVQRMRREAVSQSRASEFSGRQPLLKELAPVWEIFLKGIAEAFQDRAVLQNYTLLSAYDVRLEALALNESAQRECISGLMRRVSPGGWYVVPESASALQPGAERSPWRFCFRVSRSAPDYPGNAALMYLPEEEGL